MSNPNDIEALEIQMAELSNWRRFNADKAGTPEFRKVNLMHRTLARFFESSIGDLALVAAELRKIEDGTHHELLKKTDHHGK